MTTVVDKLVPDELWAIVEALLPPRPRPPCGGRHRTIPDRNCFAAVMFMARSSTPWRLLPAGELGCGSSATAWRRLDEWAKAGCSSTSTRHPRPARRAGPAGPVARERRPGQRTGQRGGPRRRKSGRPWQARVENPSACEGDGLPPAAVVTAANAPDVTMLQAVVDDIPPVRAPSGRRRSRPSRLDAGKGYASAANRAYLRRRGISARIARRGIESSARLGGIAGGWSGRCRGPGCCRRLQVRWDRGSDRWFAFVLLACALVRFKRL